MSIFKKKNYIDPKLFTIYTTITFLGANSSQ